MTQKKYEYKINGVKYIQNPLVLAQVKQLPKLLENMELSLASASEIMYALGDKLPGAMAIALTPENVPLKEKNLDDIAADMEFATINTSLQVVEDFLDCNLILSVLDRIGEIQKKIMAKPEEKPGQAGSTTPSSSSQKETSQKETKSSGASP